MRLADLLAHGFPGAIWELREVPSDTAEENYARIVWHGPGDKPTLAEIQAAEAAAATALANMPKSQAKAAFEDDATAPDAARAVALVALDEVNTLRQWITSFKAAVAASTSLADLRTRVAALAQMPDRTAAQLKAAVRNKIDAE